MPFLQDARDINIQHSTLVDIGRDQVVIQVKYNLPYADGASWNGTQVCLPGTRVQLLEDIMHHITTTDVKDGAQIVLLEDVAGSGKSAIAHTISQRCYEMGLLASSFFFDREISGRNGLEKLFSTIALDLAGRSKNLADAIDLALEQQRSLPSAALSRQFDELILKPLQCHPIDKPVVVVIDALDESWSSEPNIELLTILRDYVPKLPGNFRMFITSRPLKEIDIFISKANHVSRLAICISDEANRQDIAVYAKSQLEEVAEWGKLGDDWPDEQLLSDFTKMAEGLFLWVSTVCKYIRNTIDPVAELRLLLSRRSPQKIPAENKMDKLYSTILESCNWDDEKFVDGYKVIMGAIMAAKSPLSARALQALYSTAVTKRHTVQSNVLENTGSLPGPRMNGTSRYRPQLSLKQRIFRRFTPPLPIVRPQSSYHSGQTPPIVTLDSCSLTVPVSAVLRPLGSLLTGITDMNQPVRILHLSFRDFVTIRAQLSPASEQFHLSEKEHSQRLALLCLLVLNENLTQGMPGTGYLAGDESVTPGIPEITEGHISEQVWYACRFWLDHIIDTKHLVSVELVTALWDLFSTRIVLWVEIVTAKGRFRNLRKVREWLQNTLSEETALIKAIFNRDLALSFHTICRRLLYMCRLEEALDAIQEAVEMQRKLAIENPTEFSSSLANSLDLLSVCLSNMGHRDEALGPNQEAVEMWQKLATEHPEKYNQNLSLSLHNLVVKLRHLGRQADALGRREEALDMIQQAVNINRKLAAEHAAVYNPPLAISLVVLSNCLLETQTDRRHDALSTIQEATEILQNLAAEHPAAFNPDFAYSLHNLSHCLHSVGRRGEALGAIQRAVAIREKLAIERPAAFTVALTYSLHDLTACLSDVDRYEEALVTVRKAAQIQRGLAMQYPLVFRPLLINSLMLLFEALSSLGKEEEAWDTMEEVYTLMSLI